MIAYKTGACYSGVIYNYPTQEIYADNQCTGTASNTVTLSDSCVAADDDNYYDPSY